MHDDGVNLLERGVAAHDRIEDRERDAADHEWRDDEEHQLEDRCRVDEVLRHRLESIELLLVHRPTAKRLRLRDLLIEHGVAADLGGHEGGCRRRAHQIHGEKRAEPAWSRGDIRIRRARREQHADEPRQQTLGTRCRRCGFRRDGVRH